MNVFSLIYLLLSLSCAHHHRRCCFISTARYSRPRRLWHSKQPPIVGCYFVLSWTITEAIETWLHVAKYDLEFNTTSFQLFSSKSINTRQIMRASSTLMLVCGSVRGGTWTWAGKPQPPQDQCPGRSSGRSAAFAQTSGSTATWWEESIGLNKRKSETLDKMENLSMYHIDLIMVHTWNSWQSRMDLEKVSRNAAQTYWWNTANPSSSAWYVSHWTDRREFLY